MPRAPDELTELLAGYRSALQVADDLPPLLTVKAGEGRYTRRILVPRLRMFLRYFLMHHVQRRIALLQRAFHADAALGADRMGELAALDHFDRSLVPVPVRRLLVSLAVSVLVVSVALANVARALWEEPLSEAGDALGGSFKAVVSVDTDGLIDAAGKFDPASGVAACLVITLSLYVVSALPIASFRLKRMLLNLTPTDAQTLAATAALDHVRRADGLYADERRAFQSLRVRPPREIPFDIIAQGLLMLLPLLLGMALAVANFERLIHQTVMDALGSAILLSVGAWLCLVIPLGRLAHLWAIWRRREADAAGLPGPDTFTRDELARPLRRLAAFLIDVPLIFVVSVGLLALILALPIDESLMTVVWWFAAIPLAMAITTVPFMLRGGRRAGQTLGKQAVGIRVVCDGHGDLSPQRAIARELLVKAPFWTGPSVALLFLPAVINGVWSVFDPERRALQDRATGTRVVRA
jgi:uncharacterized RDD family membrane protein YckC